jgi:hypothetical protein
MAGGILGFDQNARVSKPASGGPGCGAGDGAKCKTKIQPAVVLQLAVHHGGGRPMTCSDYCRLNETDYSIPGGEEAPKERKKIVFPSTMPFDSKQTRKAGRNCIAE